MTYDELKEIGEKASINIAAGPDHFWHGDLLEPHLWEALRVEMQRRYRRATGESMAVLSIENSPDANHRVIAPADFEEKLSDFLEALDEWGCEDNAERAQHILEFQRTGYDLDVYLVEHPDRDKSELN